MVRPPVLWRQKRKVKRLLVSKLNPNDIVLDHTVTIEPEIPPNKWPEFYLIALKNLKPGVTEFVIHPGYDNDEMRAATKTVSVKLSPQSTAAA